MQRRYPEPIGPKSESELMAWLFGLLHGAYSMLAQYEEDVKQTEHQRLRDFVDEIKVQKEKAPDKNTYTFTEGSGAHDSEAAGPSPL
jgi:hypothetical protein